MDCKPIINELLDDPEIRWNFEIVLNYLITSISLDKLLSIFDKYPQLITIFDYEKYFKLPNCQYNIFKIFKYINISNDDHLEIVREIINRYDTYYEKTYTQQLEYNEFILDTATHSGTEHKVSDTATHSGTEHKVSDTATHSGTEHKVSDTEDDYDTFYKHHCNNLQYINIEREIIEESFTYLFKQITTIDQFKSFMRIVCNDEIMIDINIIIAQILVNYIFDKFCNSNIIINDILFELIDCLNIDINEDKLYNIYARIFILINDKELIKKRYSENNSYDEKFVKYWLYLIDNLDELSINISNITKSAIL